MCGGEAFGNLLEDGGEPVVCLVAGCPEGVAATVLGSCDDFEETVIGRYWLESDAEVETSIRECRTRGRVFLQR